MLIPTSFSSIHFSDLHAMRDRPRDNNSLIDSHPEPVTTLGLKEQKRRVVTNNMRAILDSRSLFQTHRIYPPFFGKDNHQRYKAFVIDDLIFTRVVLRDSPPEHPPHGSRIPFFPTHPCWSSPATRPLLINDLFTPSIPFLTGA